MYLTHGSRAGSVEGFGDRDGRRGARGTEDHREVRGIGDSSESLVGSDPGDIAGKQQPRTCRADAAPHDGRRPGRGQEGAGCQRRFPVITARSMDCSSEPGVIVAGAGALPRARRRCEAGKRTHGPGTRACLALLAATALLALAAPAQAQTTTVTQSGDGATWSLVGENTVAAGQQTYTYTLTRTSGSLPLNEYFGFTSDALEAERFQDGYSDCTGTNYFCFTLSNSYSYSEFTVSPHPRGRQHLPRPRRRRDRDTHGQDLELSGVSLTIGTDITVKLTAAPTNTAAMGAPTITGTAQVGQTLTAVTTGITDADGLTSPTYTYQWIRVDGVTEADIAGENSSTYTLDDADLGKTIKVKVSFDDDASNTETLTSAATVTVTAAASTNTAPTAADKTVTTGEDRAYAFTADDFGFDDDDAGATLASVTIVTLPMVGTLALDGTAVMADDVVTTAQIDGDMLTFTPARDAHGDPYTTFTFTVNDGTDDSASAYTMTIDVTDAPPPVCAVPSFGDRREIWTGTVTVERGVLVLGCLVTDSLKGVAGTLLPSQSFFHRFEQLRDRRDRLGPPGPAIFPWWIHSSLTATERAALRLHVCDGDYDFSTAAANTTTWFNNPRLVAPGGDPHGVSEPAGEQRRDGRAGDYRHGAGRAGADRRREPHHGHRRVALELHLPVGAGGRGRHVEPGGHHRRDRRHLHPDRRRRGQEDQGAGELHRRAERRGGAHQRGVSLVRHGHRAASTTAPALPASR